MQSHSCPASSRGERPVPSVVTHLQPLTALGRGGVADVVQSLPAARAGKGCARIPAKPLQIGGVSSAPARGAPAALRTKEDAERRRLATTWLGFADLLKEDSAMLKELGSGDSAYMQLLFMDRAASWLGTCEAGDFG